MRILLRLSTLNIIDQLAKHQKSLNKKSCLPFTAHKEKNSFQGADKKFRCSTKLSREK